MIFGAWAIGVGIGVLIGLVFFGAAKSEMQQLTACAILREQSDRDRGIEISEAVLAGRRLFVYYMEQCSADLTRKSTFRKFIAGQVISGFRDGRRPAAT